MTVFVFVFFFKSGRMRTVLMYDTYDYVEIRLVGGR